MRDRRSVFLWKNERWVMVLKRLLEPGFKLCIPQYGAHQPGHLISVIWPNP